MSEFRTKIKSNQSIYDLKYDESCVFIGSCFSVNIGNWLKELKFEVDINPFGIVYNPISISKSLDDIINEYEFKETDIYYFNEKWTSFSHHSSFSSQDKTECLNKINTTISYFNSKLKQSKYLFITLGTAWCYKYKKTDKIVANCHKLPSSEYEKRLLSAEEIYDEYVEIIEKLLKFNKDIKIVFSVSPIRHIKEGIENNSLSKAVLIYSINKLKQKFENVQYFPAYEIMIDDLRDYRFYEEDMIHPNITAIKYIRKVFSNMFFNKQTLELTEDISKVIIAKNHRIFNESANKTNEFAENMLNKISAIKSKNDFINFEEEEKHFIELIKGAV